MAFPAPHFYYNSVTVNGRELGQGLVDLFVLGSAHEAGAKR